MYNLVFYYCKRHKIIREINNQSYHCQHINTINSRGIKSERPAMYTWYSICNKTALMLYIHKPFQKENHGLCQNREALSLETVFVGQCIACLVLLCVDSPGSSGRPGSTISCSTSHVESDKAISLGGFRDSSSGDYLVVGEEAIIVAL